MNDTDIPTGYIGCMADDATCPQAARCLRALAYRLRARQPEQPDWLTIINPANTASRYATPQCAHFRPATPVRYVKGMQHLFDNVPLAQAGGLRRDVGHCFTSRRMYYRYRTGEYLLPPRMQEDIARIFRRHGIADGPCFDNYVESYDW